YIHYLEGNGEELYDLNKDPGEICNLAHTPKMRHVLEEHRKLLQEHIARTNDPYFSESWKVAPRWRSHVPGYQNHRGPSAPMLAE
ncbi:MAG: sulfatase, partial [Chthoniobacterales bacterium]